MLQKPQQLDKEDIEKLANNIEQVQNPGETPFYVIKSLGKTNFLIKHKGSKYKVAIGERNECSCSMKRSVNCVHILFVLLKIYGLETDSALLKKVAFNEYELQNILQGKKCYYEKKKHLFATKESSFSDDSPKKRGPRQIEEGDCCPICMDEISEKEIDVTLVCCRYSCGNYIHATCLREYFTNSYQKQRTCPFCRFDWKNDLDNQMLDLKKKKMKKKEENTVTAFNCAECQSQLDSKKKIFVCHFCYKCRNSVVPFCGNCYKSKDVHIQHKGKYYVARIGNSKKIDHEILKEEEITDRQKDIMPFANSNEGVGSTSPTTCQIHSFPGVMMLPKQLTIPNPQSSQLNHPSPHQQPTKASKPLSSNLSFKNKDKHSNSSEDLDSLLSIVGNTFTDQPKSPRKQYTSSLKRGFTFTQTKRAETANQPQNNLDSLLTITNHTTIHLPVAQHISPKRK